MSEPLSLMKAVSLDPVTLVKTTSATVKGLLVIALIGYLGWTCWVSLIQPHTKWAVQTKTTQQKADTIVNYNGLDTEEIIAIVDKQIAKNEKKFFLGIRLFGVKLGVEK